MTYAISFLAFSAGIYIIARAIAIPYELKTDREWKLKEEPCCYDEEDPDDPAREEIPEGSHEVIELRSRQAG